MEMQGQGLLPGFIVHHEDVPLTARGGHAVPGYSGHVPGKGPEEANMGKRFAAANEHGFRSLRGEATQAQASNQRKCRNPHGNIPGYSGHIPGKLEESCGATWRNVNLRLHSGSPMPTPRMEVRPGEWANLDRQPLASEAQGRATLRPGTGHAASAVPGYAGHVPGKLSENIVGARCAAANAMAATAELGTTAWRRTEAPGVVASRDGAGAAAGKAVPGYTGYVHGKLPEPDVMGMPFRAANEHADKVRVNARVQAKEADAAKVAAAQRPSQNWKGEGADLQEGTVGSKFKGKRLLPSFHAFLVVVELLDDVPIPALVDWADRYSEHTPFLCT
ncbi:unnamed protein product [Symbiodinium natans]|uniref:Uncharacterized protein n=1 Tax=Symbiodinium natans TaxID=878477 RepID=A0A812HBN9_9DINO|nr:unnamed protein product [Symbiodinium natans]